jgi:F0F1-type ATP synthase assembly protein I
MPYALANVVLLVTYIAGPKERNFLLQTRTFYFGEALEILFFFIFFE